MMKFGRWMVWPSASAGRKQAARMFTSLRIEFRIGPPLLATFVGMLAIYGSTGGRDQPVVIEDGLALLVPGDIGQVRARHGEVTDFNRRIGLVARTGAIQRSSARGLGLHGLLASCIGGVGLPPRPASGNTR